MLVSYLLFYLFYIVEIWSKKAFTDVDSIYAIYA